MASPAKLLILGGSTEAAVLAGIVTGTEEFHDAHGAAKRFQEDSVTVITSLAGRTTSPAVLPGDVRSGGFGGVAGLKQFLYEEAIDAVIDATHPCTAVMPFNVAEACSAMSVPRLRVLRPPWERHQGDNWASALDLDAAASLIAEDNSIQRVLLTIGRQGISAFASLDNWFLVRCVDPPEPQPLRNAEIILDKGPFSLENEIDLLKDRGIDALVTKNSGGSATEAKLQAARELGLKVIMIDRPPAPIGPQVATSAEAVMWFASTIGVKL